MDGRTTEPAGSGSDIADFLAKTKNTDTAEVPEKTDKKTRKLKERALRKDKTVSYSPRIKSNTVMYLCKIGFIQGVRRGFGFGNTERQDTNDPVFFGQRKDIPNVRFGVFSVRGSASVSARRPMENPLQSGFKKAMMLLFPYCSV